MLVSGYKAFSALWIIGHAEGILAPRRYNNIGSHDLQGHLIIDNLSTNGSLLQLSFYFNWRLTRNAGCGSVIICPCPLLAEIFPRLKEDYIIFPNRLQRIAKSVLLPLRKSVGGVEGDCRLARSSPQGSPSPLSPSRNS